MKTLLLLRHAKSSWDDASLSDFDRPLNERGKRAAPFMGGLMRRRVLLPDVIVSSPAIRARTTAELVKHGGSFDAALLLDASVYEASPRSLREALASLGDEHSSVLLIGHNPGIEGFIRYLTGEIQSMPTTGLAVIELDIDKWNEIDDGCGELKDMIRPRDEMG